MIDVKDKYKCCGCSACVQKCPKRCIKLIEDYEGFMYPKVNQKECINCGLCDKVCPFQYEIEKKDPQKVLAAYNKDEEVRRKSSSGGIFTFLAERILNNGGVVFGARFNEKWEVILDYTDSIEGIEAFRGSKYVQASVGNTYKQCEQFLQKDRQVLFTGTPCQIAGLKRYLAKEYDNLLTVDVVCHGVPSPMVWRKYLQELIKEHKADRRAEEGKSTVSSSLNDMSFIEGISFRDKSEGWKKFRFVLKFAEAQAEGKQSSVLSSISESHQENIFMKAFLSDLILRPSCYQCPYRGKNLRQADISIADFWGVQDILPEMDDDKGTSLVIVNTEKGNVSVEKSDVICCETDLRHTSVYNGGLQEYINHNKRRYFLFKSVHRKISIRRSFEICSLPDSEYEYAITPMHRKVLRKLKRFFMGFF